LTIPVAPGIFAFEKDATLIVASFGPFEYLLHPATSSR